MNSTLKLIDKINREHPVGTMPLKYISSDGSHKEAKVRFPAEILESGKVVIWLEGELDSIELKNVII